MHGSIVAWVSLRAFLGEPPPVVWRASATSPRLPLGTEKRVFQPKLPPRTLCLCRSQSLLQGCRSISLARLRLALPRTLLASFLFVQVADQFNPSLRQLLHQLRPSAAARSRSIPTSCIREATRKHYSAEEKDAASCGMVCAANNRSPTLGCRACSDIPGAGAQLGSKRARRRGQIGRDSGACEVPGGLSSGPCVPMLDGPAP